MQFVFVDWLIIKGQELKFKEYWRSALPIQDRSQMVGEFLSEPTGYDTFDWVTWDLRSSEATRFINVGLWASSEAFQEQIGQYFNPAKGKFDFEFELRRRALLSPAAWRMGSWPLPIKDSDGVQ